MYRIGKTATVISLAVSSAAVVLVGCASLDQKFGDAEWYQKSRDATSKAVEATRTTTAKAYDRMQKYLGEKDVLKTFHDAGEHSEGAVLAVLHKSGIGGQAGAATDGSPPKKRSPKNAPLPVPEQYSGAYRWPLDAGIVSSEYGERWGKMHKGLDIAADTGEPVYAVAAGEVIYAGDGLRGYGNVVIVRHDRRYTSLYAHNSELKVSRGDQIEQGQLIALLGSTGHSTGPHVHFEIRDGDAPVNPHGLLPRGKLASACENAECDPEDDPHAARTLASAR
jgi:murein DD-endopeptidase MepM/ murein hydrolase activator NlpD